jgi:hypothetical protein
MPERYTEAIKKGERAHKNFKMQTHLSKELNMPKEEVQRNFPRYFHVDADGVSPNPSYDHWCSGLLAKLKEDNKGRTTKSTYTDANRDAVARLEEAIQACRRAYAGGAGALQALNDVPKESEVRVDNPFLGSEEVKVCTRVLFINDDIFKLGDNVNDHFTRRNLQRADWAGHLFAMSPPFGINKFVGDGPNDLWGEDKYCKVMEMIARTHPHKNNVVIFHGNDTVLVDSLFALRGKYKYHQVVIVKGNNTANPAAHGWYSNVHYLVVFYMMGAGGAPHRGSGFWFNDNDDRTPVAPPFVFLCARTRRARVSSLLSV